MSKTPVIIVKKRRRAHHGHHGGAWKVAYADFVTAMMAFFLVLWIVGQSDAVKAGVAGYFRDPGILERGGSGILEGSAVGIDASSAFEFSQPAVDAPMDLASLEQSAQRIRELLSQLPELGDLETQIEIKATSEGLRIELVDSGDATFFDSASAVLKPATERILAVVARELGALSKPIVVEGHTDSRPFSRGAGGYTNWELSADRANAARRALERGGLPKGHVRAVRGFADRQLAETDPMSPRNRRVSILVVAPVAPSLQGAAGAH